MEIPAKMCAPVRYLPSRIIRARRGQPPQMELGNFPFRENKTRAKGRYFQIDRDLGSYLEAKEEVTRRRKHYQADGHAKIHCHVIGWMQDQLVKEYPALFSKQVPNSYEGLALSIQEDFTVMYRGHEGALPGPNDPKEDPNAAIAVYVCFPSGWRPEMIQGKNIGFIHRKVPALQKTPGPMLRLMFATKPCVRFVWTVTSDNDLDHHGDTWKRKPVTRGCKLWLRVERQVIRPFLEVNASLFLVRTYLYPFESLKEPKERDHLAAVLKTNRPEIWEYKNLTERMRSEAVRQLRGI